MMHFCHEDLLIFANSADTDKMPHNAAFHLGLHFMQHFIWVFTACQSNCLQVSRMKRFKCEGTVTWVKAQNFQNPEL